MPEKFSHPFPCAHESWGSLCLLHSIVFFLTLCLLHWEGEHAFHEELINIFTFLTLNNVCLCASSKSCSDDRIIESLTRFSVALTTPASEHFTNISQFTFTAQTWDQGLLPIFRITACSGLEGTISPTPLPWDSTLVMTSKGQTERKKTTKQASGFPEKQILTHMAEALIPTLAATMQHFCNSPTTYSCSSRHQIWARGVLTGAGEGQTYLGNQKNPHILQEFGLLSKQK